jgi:hypothetical protein
MLRFRKHQNVDPFGYITPVPNDAQTVDLEKLGYETSGKANGELQVFCDNIELIKRAQFVPLHNGAPSADQISRFNEKVAKLNTKSVEINSRIENINNEINKLEEVKSNSPTVKKPNLFRLVFTVILELVLIPFLWLLYIGIGYSAIYTNSLMQQITARNFAGLINVLPSTGQIVNAFHTSILLLFFPFIFFAFGWALHVLLNNESKLRYIWVGVLILFTFSLDFLMALKIHSNINNILGLVGLPTTVWYKDPNIYLILSMGFVVYIIWSILLHEIIVAFDELQNPISSIEKKIIKLQKIFSDITARMGRMQKKIELYEMLKISNTDIISNIEMFSKGWLEYLGRDYQDFKRKANECRRFKIEIVEELQKSIKSDLITDTL